MTGASSYDAHAAFLRERRCLRVSGEDRAGFLQGLITNDVLHLPEERALFAALLAPQGKILFEFFVLNTGDTFLIDCAASIAADLLKRLNFYKLRAKVAIDDVSQTWRVGAVWGKDAASLADGMGALAYPDPRLSALGWRVILGELDGNSGFNAMAADYDAMRIGLAVPEGGKDYAFGQVFPHDACFDLLHGVDFKKGCYVGQEVVSRMHHRGTARTRVLGVVGERELPAGGAEVTAEGFAVGHLGSVAGNRGIALARLDRVKEAKAKGQRLVAGDVPVELFAPSWATYTLDPAVGPEQ
jgi:folate-binding protein YgfZ